MEPNPLYMLMKNMTQRQHGPRPYDGILGASEEKVVAYENVPSSAGQHESLALEEAAAWVRERYGSNDVGTLIEIRVVAELTAIGDLIQPEAKVESRRSDDCTCTSSRTCAECLL